MPSDVNWLHIIMPKTHATHRTLAVTTFNNSLYAGIAEQMIAFCNDSLIRKQNYQNPYTIYLDKQWQKLSHIIDWYVYHKILEITDQFQ